MAKTIKFNLICDGNPIRTIEDLRNNFSIEDVLSYYENGLLQRWLRVRGYEKELEAVTALTSTDPMETIKELIRVFEVTTDGEKVEEQIYILTYLRERKELIAHYNKGIYEAENIIEDYEQGYQRLVEDILEHPDDAARIKAAIAEIVENYFWVFSLNHRELFYLLKGKTQSPLAIMCLLMNEKARTFYILTEEEISEQKHEPQKLPTEVVHTTAGNDAQKNDFHKKWSELQARAELQKPLSSNDFDNTYGLAGERVNAAVKQAARKPKPW